jgi:hypothetical protein
LVYSPLMIFSILGLFFTIRKHKNWVWFIIPVCLIYYFIIASWWCWWYAGFGNRAFINLYPILAFPLAAAVHYFMSRPRIVRIGFNAVLIAGIMLCFIQTYQFKRGFIHWGDMTKDAYWDIFLDDGPSELYSTYLRAPALIDQKNGRDKIYSPKVRTVYTKNYTFDSPSSSDSTFSRFVTKTDSKNGNRIVSVPSGTQYIGDIRIIPNDQINEIYITAWVKGVIEGETHLTLSNSINTFVKISHEIVETKKGWSKIHSLTPIPDAFLADTLHFTIWNQGTKEFLVDNISFYGRNRSFDITDVKKK